MKRVRVLGWAKLGEARGEKRKVQCLLTAPPSVGVHFTRRRKLQTPCCSYRSFWKAWGPSESSCRTHPLPQVHFWTDDALLGSELGLPSPRVCVCVLFSFPRSISPPCLSPIFLLGTHWTCTRRKGAGSNCLEKCAPGPLTYQSSLHIDLWPMTSQSRESSASPATTPQSPGLDKIGLLLLLQGHSPHPQQ